METRAYLSDAWDSRVYATPDPVRVARLVASHGIHAAYERWSYLGQRTVMTLAREGRIALGVVGTNARPPAGTELQGLAAVEAAYVLSGRTAGGRAVGLTYSATVAWARRRGISADDLPRDSTRTVRAHLTRRVQDGDAEAAATLAVMDAHELAVGRVLMTALALVPQPSHGRARLPSPSATLRAALAGAPAAAVEAVFPGLLGRRMREAA